MKTFTFATVAALANAFIDINAIKSNVNGMESMTITENGQTKTVYLGHPDWYSGVADDGVNLPEGARSYFFNTPDVDPNAVYRPNLLGGSVEFDIDMSGVECGCIAAFYLAKMPAYDASGNVEDRTSHV